MATPPKKAEAKARVTTSVKTAPASHYRFRYHAEGIELEFEGDRDFVLTLIQSYAPPKHAATSSASTKSLNTQDAEQAVKTDKTISVREFILQFGLKKHTDLVLAFGYFIEKNMGQDSFTPADINGLYYDAKMEASNTSQMLIQNIKRGFVMEAKGAAASKKRYTLTSSGETYLIGLSNQSSS